MLLVFLVSYGPAQPILQILSTLLVYFVRWTIRFWCCTGLSPKCMQTVVSNDVSMAQNAPPPNLEGELSLFASGTPITLAAVKAVVKRFVERTKQGKKIDTQVMRQDAKALCQGSQYTTGSRQEDHYIIPAVTSYREPFSPACPG